MASAVCYGGSRGGVQASSVLPTPERPTFFLRFPLLLCACHRPRPAWGLPPPLSSASAPANAALSSRVRKRRLFASAQFLVCPPSAVFSCPSCSCHRLRLTRQSRGRRISGRSSPLAASRGAPHFHVRTLGSFMSLRATSIGHLTMYQAATPVVIGSPRFTSVGRHSMRVAGRFVVSARVRVLSGAQPSAAVLSRQAFVRASFRHAPAQVQPVAISPIAHQVFAGAHQRSVSLSTSPFAHQNTIEKTAPSSSTRSNY